MSLQCIRIKYSNILYYLVDSLPIPATRCFEQVTINLIQDIYNILTENYILKYYVQMCFKSIF